MTTQAHGGLCRGENTLTRARTRAASLLSSGVFARSFRVSARLQLLQQRMQRWGIGDRWSIIVSESNS